MEIRDLGVIAFAEAYSAQALIVDGLLRGGSPETLLVLEHLPVYTIGRGGSDNNILDPSIEAIRINRGGDITFHGPGQLVGYPIVDLSRRGRDLHRYMRFLEELIVLTVADFGVKAYRIAGRTGAWTERGKLASIGVGAQRWVSMHGFSINVKPVLEGFRRINPCGIEDCRMTSMELECGSPVPLHQVKAGISERFESLLEEWLPMDASPTTVV